MILGILFSKYSSDQLSGAPILDYVDDVLITARDKQTCEILADIVYQELTFEKMYLPESKIQRCEESVEIIGQILQVLKSYAT